MEDFKNSQTNTNDDKSKKIIIGLSAALVFVLVVFGYYVFFGNKNSKQQVAEVEYECIEGDYVSVSSKRSYR
jgi:flagellar basal body-associated protein FliL